MLDVNWFLWKLGGFGRRAALRCLKQHIQESMFFCNQAASVPVWFQAHMLYGLFGRHHIFPYSQHYDFENCSRKHLMSLYIGTKA